MKVNDKFSMKFVISCMLASMILSIPINSLAVTSTGQARVTTFADATITHVSDAVFGLIPLSAGSSCSMDNAGAVTGDCLDDGSLSIGEFTISGLVPTAAVRFTITGGDSAGAELTFTSAASITDATTTITLADSIQSTAGSFTTTAVPDNITVEVYGDLVVNSLLTANTAYAVDYTLDVIYE